MSKPRDYETRKQNAFRRFGTDRPVCVVCGRNDWRGLEQHHIAGRKHHDDLAITCGYCHSILSDSQCDHPPPGTPDSSIGCYLLGLADLFAMIAERFREFGRHLIETGEGNPPKSGGGK